MANKTNFIEEKTALGIEFGSTRIKAVLIDESCNPIASGSYDWENKLENGYWTYSIDDILTGLRASYASLKKNVLDKFGIALSHPGAIGISGMMHGYLAFDKDDNLLTPFRTWRNTTTGEAAAELSSALDFNIPQRWSCAHLYQAVLNGEEHISRIAHVTTLAGYIHYLLTGCREVGIGEASGIFPIDSIGLCYDAEKLKIYNLKLKSHGISFKIEDVIPAVRTAGEKGAFLTESGAKLLDPDGDLVSGIPMCPPEGDAGTGMAATNSVRVRTGNISAGTSVFSMLVLEKKLSKTYPEIDMVTTPDGAPVAMVHCNNCCGEIDAWAKIFGEFAAAAGLDIPKYKVYDTLYYLALNGDKDCGGVVSYNFLSGEHILGVKAGHPMYFRAEDGKMNLSNFFRAQIYSSVAALKSGMDLLLRDEGVKADCFTGHGGLFKTEGVAQQFLANAINTPVSVMKTAGEGGAWGMAVLAQYMMQGEGKTLPDYLDENVFASMESTTLSPTEDGHEGFEHYMQNYKAGLAAQYALNVGGDSSVKY